MPPTQIIIGATYQHINEQVPVVVETIAQIVGGQIIAYRDNEGVCRALPYEGFVQTFERIDDSSLQVILIRGIPGVGKTFYVNKHYPEAIHCSADLLFTVDGLYIFDQKRLGEAHAFCMNQFLWAMEKREPVIVVDNTFSRRWEFLNYVMAACMNGYNVRIIDLTCRAYDLPAITRRGTHNVPAHIVEDMYHRWEDSDRELLGLPEYYEMRIENQTVEVENPNAWRGFDEFAVRKFFEDHPKLMGRINQITRQIWIWKVRKGIGNESALEARGITEKDGKICAAVVDTNDPRDVVGWIKFPIEYLWDQNWREKYNDKDVELD